MKRECESWVTMYNPFNPFSDKHTQHKNSSKTEQELAENCGLGAKISLGNPCVNNQSSAFSLALYFYHLQVLVILSTYESMYLFGVCFFLFSFPWDISTSSFVFPLMLQRYFLMFKSVFSIIASNYIHLSRTAPWGENLFWLFLKQIASHISWRSPTLWWMEWVDEVIEYLKGV